MLALSKGYLKFGETFVVDVHTERNDGLAGVFGCFLEFAQFALGHEELAVAEHVVVGITAELVLGYMHLLGEQFVAYELAIRISKARLRFTDRLDLRTEKLDAGCVALQYLVVESSPTVLDIYLTLKMHK